MDMKQVITIGAVIGGLYLAYKNRDMWMSETFNAHVSPSQDQFVARNWGTIERVSTERNIMAGQAVGQTINYNGMGITPATVGATNGIGQVMDLSVYAATKRSTDPIWGQNYPGRAIGQE